MAEPAIVILNYNGFDNTQKCIRSIKKQIFNKRQIFIIDNNSIDGSREKLISLYGDDYHIYKTPKNTGFSGGMNLGIRKCIEKGHKYAILFNNDTELIQNNTISSILKVLIMSPSIGVVSPIIVNDKYGYKIQKDLIIDSKTIFKFFYSYIAPPYKNNINFSNKYNYNGLYLQELEMLHGVAFGINLKVFEKTKMFNEKFFCYEEDRDLFIRIRNCGFKLIRIENLKIYHKWSGATKKNSNFVIYHRTRNLWYMRNTYHSKRFIFFSYIKLFLVAIKNKSFHGFIRGLLFHLDNERFKWC